MVECDVNPFATAPLPVVNIRDVDCDASNRGFLKLCKSLPATIAVFHMMIG